MMDLSANETHERFLSELRAQLRPYVVDDDVDESLDWLSVGIVVHPRCSVATVAEVIEAVAQMIDFDVRWDQKTEAGQSATLWFTIVPVLNVSFRLTTHQNQCRLQINSEVIRQPNVLE